jgi:hypothetical protein
MGQGAGRIKEQFFMSPRTLTIQYTNYKTKDSHRNIFILVGQVGWDGLVLVVRAKQGSTTSSTQLQNQNDSREPIGELIYSKSIVEMKV